MASACVNSISMDCPPPPPPSPPNKFTSFSWLSPPKNISCNHPSPDEEADSDPTTCSASDFEFQLEGADVTMLPADELFSDGKLVPLHHHQRPPEEPPKLRLRNEEEVGPGTGPINDLFSPRAPTCSSRWKELLGFKRFYHNTTTNKQHKTTPAAAAAAAASHNNKSLKSFLHRNQKSSVSDSSSLTLPLIQPQPQPDNNNDSFSTILSSSRLSLSSSSCSSSGGGDDFPRHSLDSDKLNFRRTSNFSHHHHRSRQFSKEKSILSSSEIPPESIRTIRSSLRKDAELISADSPRMNSCGKIVFHSLERSSSSPSTLNGGPRYKYRGMERSYSANVRYTPVLNVPVCSLRGSSSSSSAGVFGFPLFSPPSQQKKDGGGDSVKGNRKNRSDPRIN